MNRDATSALDEEKKLSLEERIRLDGEQAGVEAEA